MVVVVVVVVVMVMVSLPGRHHRRPELRLGAPLIDHQCH